MHAITTLYSILIHCRLWWHLHSSRRARTWFFKNLPNVRLIVPVDADSVAWDNTLKPMLLPISSLIVPETKYNPSDEEFDWDLNKFETVLIGGGGRVQRCLEDFPGVHVSSKLALIAEGGGQADEELDDDPFSIYSDDGKSHTSYSYELDCLPPLSTPLGLPLSVRWSEDCNLEDVRSFAIRISLAPNRRAAWIASLPMGVKMHLPARFVARLAICIDVDGQQIRMTHREFRGFVEALAAARGVEQKAKEVLGV